MNLNYYRFALFIQAVTVVVFPQDPRFPIFQKKRIIPDDSGKYVKYEGNIMKMIRGMIVSLIFTVRNIFVHKPNTIEISRVGVPPKNYQHLYTMMDRGREVF